MSDSADPRRGQDGAEQPVPELWERKDEVFRRIRAGRPVLFLDFDGTLAPIVQRPEDASITEEMRVRVRNLADLHPVAVVSGRDLPDVRRRVGLEDIIYAGSHGFDIEGPAGMRMQHEEATRLLPVMDRLEEELRDALAGVEGCEIERKKFSLAVHYRRVSEEEVSRVEEEVDRRLVRHDRLRKTSGKKVFDIQPRLDWDKGRAMLWLLDALRDSGVLEGRKAREAMEGNDRAPIPIFIGDDVTDEDAFRVLAETGKGIGIAVQEAPAPTAAAYRLSDPDDVAAFLDLLVEEAGGSR